ncbi:MAG: response regulator transcription factor [Anaerolineae bacterium]|nr:MAG: response regulator transcription factor [Anaerolineae bacterium]
MVASKILVLDDEPAIRKLLKTGLKSYGYDITMATSGQEALSMAARHPPDLILLDVDLGGHPDGLAVCRQLREWSTTPIIMLTVHDDKQIKLAGLNAGADDYVTKPFDMDELEARIRAVLRRSAYEHTHSPTAEVQIHDLTLDLVNRRVKLSGVELHLTPKEYDLLKLLATNPGKVLTFAMLLKGVWGEFDSREPEHNVRVYINTLRKKLKDDPTTTLKPRYIFNEPGIGYRFADIQTPSITELKEE